MLSLVMLAVLAANPAESEIARSPVIEEAVISGYMQRCQRGRCTVVNYVGRSSVNVRVEIDVDGKVAYRSHQAGQWAKRVIVLKAPAQLLTLRVYTRSGNFLAAFSTTTAP